MIHGLVGFAGAVDGPLKELGLDKASFTKRTSHP